MSVSWFDYLLVNTEGDKLKRKPFEADQKKWAKWNKDILGKWLGVWCRVYEDKGDGNWDWYFEATQDHFDSMWGRYRYDFRYPWDTGRENKEIWVKRSW